MSAIVSRIRRQFSDARHAKRAGLILLALAAFTVVGTSAWAYWTTHGTGTASATTGTLTAPTNPVASYTTGTSTVDLTWTASGTPAPTGYYVTRSSGNATGCGTSAAPISITSCTDTSVVNSTTYTYTVTAVYNSWTATSGSSNAVTISTVGPASKLAFTTQPSATAASQVAFATQPVVTVQDASGNTVTTDTSLVTLTLTTPSGATLACTANPKAAVAGIATFADCQVDKAGSYTLTATDGALTDAVSASFNVTFGPATQIVLTGGTSLASASSETLTATIKDAAGNSVTGGTDATRVVTFAQTGAGSVSSLGTATAVGGVATKSVTGVLAGPVNLTAAATLTQGSTTSNTLAVTVTFGPAAQIVLTGGTSLASGSSETLTATIEDAAGNTVTSGVDSSRSVTFAKTTGTGTLTGLGSATASGGVATNTVTGVLSGPASLTAAAPLTQGSTTSNTRVVTVTFGPATQIALTGGTSLGSGSSETLTATIKDAAGNTVTSGVDSSRSVTFAKTTGTGTLTGLGAATASGGVATKSVAGGTVGPVGVTATATLTQGSTTSNTLAVSVNAAPTITSPTTAAPYNAGHNTGAHTITVTGTNFQSGLTVTASGVFTVNSYTFIDATSISVNLTGSGGNNQKGDLTVTNLDGGTVTTTNSLNNG